MKLTREAIGLGGLKTVTFTPSEPVEGSSAPVTDQGRSVKKEDTDAKKPQRKPSNKTTKSSMDAVVTPVSG